MYEKVKYQNEAGKVRITTMPDKRNFVVAASLPDDLLIVDKQQLLKRIPNQENGHHIAFLTTPNLANDDNFVCNMFANVIENAALGYRGKEVFAPRHLHNASYILRNAAIFGQRHNLKNNGLSILAEKLQGHKRFGMVRLEKTERSETAALADLLD